MMRLVSLFDVSYLLVKVGISVLSGSNKENSLQAEIKLH